MTPFEIESTVDDLMAVLDDQAGLLDAKRAQLASLSEMLLRDDNEAIEAMLIEIERAEETQTLLARTLQALRRALAGGFGRDPSRFTLSWLIGRLSEPRSTELAARRSRISEKVREFRRQHLQTTVLLTECSRITGMMLDQLSPAGSVVTYDAEGSDRWRADAGILDMER